MSSQESGAVAGKVMAPAIALIVVAAIGILGNLCFLVTTLLAPKVDVAAQVKAQNPNMPAEQAEFATKVAGYVTNAGPAIYVILLLVHGLILFGGIQMLRLRSYG